MNKAKIREEVKKLNPIDDLMFRKMAEERDFCEEILRVILEEPDLVVLENKAQYDITNLQGRSVILDALCLLGDGRQVNVEVQRADDDDHQKRMRYNSSVLTANIMDPGKKFKNVPEVYAVFISEFDIFNSGRVRYHVDRVIRETRETVNNGFYEVYVNAAVKDGSDISELMSVFTDDTVYSDKFPVTSNIKHRYKETEKGRKTMNNILDRAINDINMLNMKLIELNRMDDLKRSVVDRDYQDKLFAELFPSMDEESRKGK